MSDDDADSDQLPSFGAHKITVHAATLRPVKRIFPLISNAPVSTISTLSPVKRIFTLISNGARLDHFENVRVIVPSVHAATLRPVKRIFPLMSNGARLDHFENVHVIVPSANTLLRAHVPAPHDRGLETNRRAFEDPQESPADPEFGDVGDAERHKVPNAAHGDEGREVFNEYGVCNTICPRPHAHRE